MPDWRMLRLKNAMILANLISNFIGVAVVIFLTQRLMPLEVAAAQALTHRLNMVFLPISFLLPLLITLRYERPIRRFLDAPRVRGDASETLAREARRRLLNEPFFLIALDLAIWLVAGVLYPFVLWLNGFHPAVVESSFLTSLLTGLVTTTVAFFVFEFVLQRRLAPYFFPAGGLYATPGARRISIGKRLTALLLACNLVPCFAFLITAWSPVPAGMDPADMLAHTRSAIAAQCLVFAGVGVWLTFLVTSNLKRPLTEMTRVLQAVRRGDFRSRVRVTSNDELGYAGDVINEMNRGLEERDFIKETFGKYVTEEIRDEILSGRIPLDGEMKDATVLFADLRNYTPMVEATPPKEVVRIINAYFQAMDEVIQSKKGLVLQFIGDEIEAVFGAPVSQPDHPALAVEAALEMSARLKTLNQDLRAGGWLPLSHGIGIHTGPVLAANIGSRERLSYALVGDTVNVASRLQEMNKLMGTEIILSGSTAERLSGRFSLRRLERLDIKGKRVVVEMFTTESAEAGGRDAASASCEGAPRIPTEGKE